MRRTIRYLLVLWMLCCLTACQKNGKESVSIDVAEEVYATPADTNSKNIFVYVCGAVNAEGVYELPEGSRVFEAIEAAGGFRTDAAVTEVNQAEVLEDEMHLYVPTITEIMEHQSGQDGKININKATKEELMTLPGVGASRAESILQYRKEQGPFKNVEDIMLISGIKEGLYEKIKDLIKI